MKNGENAKTGREAVLARIKNALADVSGENAEQPLAFDSFDSDDLLNETELRTTSAEAELVEKFQTELKKVGGNFFAADSVQAAANHLTELFREKNIRRVVGWSQENLDEQWLKRILQTGEIEFYADGGGDKKEFISICEKADAGITRADYAIAETGTLALLSGAGRSRAVSLLPPIHVALVNRGKFVRDLAEFFAKSDAANTAEFPPSAIIFITGPSRTADIELKLVVGVHGAQELHVVLC